MTLSGLTLEPTMPSFPNSQSDPLNQQQSMKDLQQTASQQAANSLKYIQEAMQIAQQSYGTVMKDLMSEGYSQESAMKFYKGLMEGHRQQIQHATQFMSQLAGQYTNDVQKLYTAASKPPQQ
jgi:hypothetical protein